MIGGVFAGIFAIFVIVAAFVFFKNRRTKKPSTNGGVAFENPSYLKETNVEQVHVIIFFTISFNKILNQNFLLQIQTISNHQQNQELEVPTTSVISNGNIPSATEVNPTLYEELKLGSERGFKKLVS